MHAGQRSQATRGSGSTMCITKTSQGGYPMKTITIGLLGFGTVGGGAYDALKMVEDKTAEKLGTELRFKKILVGSLGKKRRDDIDPSVFTTDADEILNDPEIDIVAEAMGGIEPAASYMLKAMQNGKHVVTANKAAVAHNYEALTKAAEENGVLFRMEACVAGGIPVLSAITQALQANRFEEILGILNGTTNYIMTQMAENGLTYDEVLKDAQAKGFAEADPTDDVEGIDAANKLSILMALAFGKYVHPADIPREGITGVTMDDIENAKAEGKTIKLIASAVDNGGELEYSVRPTAIPNDHPLAAVSNEYNAVFVKGSAVGELMFRGKGAGALPTGSALGGDILNIIALMR